MLVHSNGINVVHADSHVKWRRVGMAVAPAQTSANDALMDPWAQYDAKGFPTGGYYGEANRCHSYLFRPTTEYPR